MKAIYLLFLLASFASESLIQAQTSTGSGLQAIIPPNLIDCYRNQSLLTRENLPPMTLNSLLAIIRQLENTPGVYMDMRTMSSQIMNTYRLDGIQKNADVAATQYVTPYGPSGNEFYRFKILVDGLIPSSGSTFSTTALKNETKCALHFMLSGSVDRTERGDESTVCNSLTNYVRWDSRVPRDVGAYQEEVEMVNHPVLHQSQIGRAPMFGQWMMDGGYSTGLSCPLESGVVYTRFGAVKFGLVLGGIAAGLQSQSVSRRNLILVAKANSIRGKPSKLPRLYTNSDSSSNISNIWAATLSGEVAEVALLQGPLSDSQIRVGVNGGWNDSVLPRYYFLQEDNANAMTDTDIRGSIDGLIIGTNAQRWLSAVGGGSTMKLSQLLDMYYSERGVLNTNIRACQRIAQFNSLYSSDDILQQSYAFSTVLENELPSAVNVEDAGLVSFNTLAVQKFVQYTATMSENQCSFSSSSYTNMRATSSVTNIVSPAVHVYLVIDFNYDYLDAARIASQIAERLEVSKFTGNISVINAKDASIVVNSTSDILGLYSNFTRNTYLKGQRGFDLPMIVRNVGQMLQWRLDLDRQLNTVGGPASVVIIVPYTTATISDTDKDYIYNRLTYLRQTVPDTRWKFFTQGPKDRFNQFVLDSNQDIFTLTLTDIPTAVDSLISNLKSIPRRIINPTCMSNYSSGSTTSNLGFRTYIEPIGGIEYYRIHPNYFYRTSGGSIRITSSSGKTLNVCWSRVNTLPGNSSGSDTCNQVTTNSYQINLDNACGDSSISSCAPFYISVAVMASSSSSIISCTDDACRYPDNIQVDITQNGLTCASSGNALKNSVLFLVSLTLASQLVNSLKL